MTNEKLLERIKGLHQDHNGMAGSPMITANLRAEPEFAHVGQNRVARQIRDTRLGKSPAL